MDFTITPTEHKFTSTGIKFWRHQEAMESYRAGTGRSVISTHISPEGACNLKCPYCSVTYRDTHQRIALPVIHEYVHDLQSRGLKAVILTGGGEPTIYPKFNELVQWLHWHGLKVALITNGTQAKRVEAKTWACFTWVRISLNVFDGWEEKIRIPTDQLSPDCTVGCSMVYTPEHRLDTLQKASAVATANQAQYVRVLPNCLLEQEKLIAQHEALDRDFASIGDARFFQQHKLHGAPGCGTCHQSYFRPYLSEVISTESGEPGTVYPCDSVVLNGQAMHFPELFQLCPASKVLDYMDKKLPHKFDPRKNCTGCVFTKNVDMLDDYARTGEGQFNSEPLKHEDFV
jgi:organic radical activating enzyme